MPTTLGHWDRFADVPVVKITADGGVVLHNPSDQGGMWAWRARGNMGELVAQASGVVVPGEIGMHWVTNNLTETLAVLTALEWVPLGWEGEVCTDSLVTIRVFTQHKRRDWLPDDIMTRIEQAVARAKRVSYTLLSGHPNRKQLAKLQRGEVVLSKRGYPYSLDNHWADTQCALAWIAAHGIKLPINQLEGTRQ